MSVLFYGDPHGRYQNLFNAVEHYSPDAVVVLGDFILDKPLQQQVAPILDKTEFWFIHGNHDTDRNGFYHNLFKSDLAHRNLHGRVETVGGLRIAGLGGVFRGKVWHPDLDQGQPRWPTREEFMLAQPRVTQRMAADQYDGLLRQHHSSIWWEDYERLWDQQAVILVTHEAPSTDHHGFTEIDDLAFAINASRVFHGHHHVNYSGELKRDQDTVLVHGVGLACCKDEAGIEL